MGQVCSKQQKDKDQLQKKTLRQSLDNSIAYQNGNFRLPQRIPFDRQSTYVKIQKAAFNFCQQNNIDLDFIACITRIIAYRQQKVFLSAFKNIPQKQRINFVQDLNKIPQDQIDLFYHNFLDQNKKKNSNNNGGLFGKIKNKDNINNFQMPKFTLYSQINNEDKLKYQNIGRKMIQNNQIALVIMCAGSNSRFQNQQKFLVPLKLKINPNLTLLDVIFMHLGLNTQAKDIPIIISFNQKNYKVIQNFLRQRNYYGINKSLFKFIQVQSLPVLDLNGQYCIDQSYKIIKKPLGTIRTVIQIIKNKFYQTLKEQGVKYLHFIGTQNLLQSPCNPLKLGLIKQRNKKILATCVHPVTQWQKMSRYTLINNKICFKLWSQLSNFNEQIISKAYRFPIPTNSLIVSFNFFDQLIKDFQSDIYLSQNYHIIRNNEKIIDPNTGKLVKKQCITFQGDIRDLLACCSDVQLYMAQRKTSYIPIISKDTQYSLNTAIQYYESQITQEYKNFPLLHPFLSFNSQIKN